MAGVRIQHPTYKNSRVTVVEKELLYGEPYQCTPPEFGGCGSKHIFKTHHLNVDDTGSVIIGDVLFEKIKAKLFLEGFQIANKVEKPPTMGISTGPQREGTGAWGNIPIIEGVTHNG